MVAAILLPPSMELSSSNIDISRDDDEEFGRRDVTEVAEGKAAVPPITHTQARKTNILAKDLIAKGMRRRRGHG